MTLPLIESKSFMRLTNQEIKSIKESFHQVFDCGKIYLFGSRVDDSLKGGDIDLFIDFKSWARTHKIWWNNPLEAHSNRDTYGNDLSDILDKWMK
jgi:predicted nucleotidyltransferase